MKIFNLKSTTRDIHIIQDSPFKGKQDLEIKHKRHVPVLHGNKTIINITQTYAHTILLLCKYCYQKVRKKKTTLAPINNSSRAVTLTATVCHKEYFVRKIIPTL